MKKFIFFASILLFQSLQGECETSVLKLQEFQKQYDEIYWFNRDFPKFRHVLLHLVDNVGKLAKYCEAKEHGKDPDPTQLIDEVLPDVLMHALQFANAFDIDLEQKYRQRIDTNIQKRTPKQTQE